MTTPDTCALTVQFITALCVTVIGTSYEVSCLLGIVTAGGDTRFGPINDLVNR